MFSISGCCLLLLPLLHQKIKCLKFESSGCGSSVCAKNMHGERLLWDSLSFDVSRVFYYGSWADLISRSIHLFSIAQMCLIFLCFFSQWERIVSVKGRDNIYFQTCSTNTRFAYSFLRGTDPWKGTVFENAKEMATADGWKWKWQLHHLVTAGA